MKSTRKFVASAMQTELTAVGPGGLTDLTG